MIQVHLVLNQDHSPRKNQNPKPKNEDQNDELQRREKKQRGEPPKENQQREDELKPRGEKQSGEKKLLEKRLGEDRQELGEDLLKKDKRADEGKIC